MDIPNEVAVMTLPNETLFPQALLPLYIFEQRYRRMLAEILHSHRMFVIAMQRRDFSRECPSTVAGLGLIRVCVDNPDGTSAPDPARDEPGGIDRDRCVSKPFRVSRIRMLQTPARDSVAIDALMAKVRDLVSERIRQGLRARAQRAQTAFRSRKSSPIWTSSTIPTRWRTWFPALCCPARTNGRPSWKQLKLSRG